MSEVGEMSVIVNQLEPYFLQKSFFAMLINYTLDRKQRKIGTN